MAIRNVLKTALKLKENYISGSSGISDEYTMNNGVLEFKYGGDSLVIADKMVELTKDLNHIGVQYFSTRPEANIALVTADRNIARKVTELMAMHNFTLSAAHYGTHLDKKDAGGEGAGSKNSYGNTGAAGGGSATGLGGLFQGYPIDRLVGE